MDVREWECCASTCAFEEIGSGRVAIVQMVSCWLGLQFWGLIWWYWCRSMSLWLSAIEYILGHIRHCGNPRCVASKGQPRQCCVCVCVCRAPLSLQMHAASFTDSVMNVLGLCNDCQLDRT